MNVGLVTLVSERKGDECGFGNTSERKGDECWFRN